MNDESNTEEPKKKVHKRNKSKVNMNQNLSMVDM